MMEHVAYRAHQCARVLGTWWTTILLAVLSSALLAMAYGDWRPWEGVEAWAEEVSAEEARPVLVSARDSECGALQVEAVREATEAEDPPSRPYVMVRGRMLVPGGPGREPGRGTRGHEGLDRPGGGTPRPVLATRASRPVGSAPLARRAAPRSETGLLRLPPGRGSLSPRLAPVDAVPSRAARVVERPVPSRGLVPPELARSFLPEPPPTRDKPATRDKPPDQAAITSVSGGHSVAAPGGCWHGPWPC